MEFKLVSKNNMGVVVTLILVILLSQSRFFDFLTETALGRMVILVLIIFISYTNKILGLLAVLAIIIAFNQYSLGENVVQSYNYYEGFDVSGNITDASGNAIASAILNDEITIEKAKEDIASQKLSALNNVVNSSQTATTTSSAASGTTTSESFNGREGFCMTDREINMLRGKQSNTIPVFNNTRNQSDDISPTDKSVFSSSYASF